VHDIRRRHSDGGRTGLYVASVCTFAWFASPWHLFKAGPGRSDEGPGRANSPGRPARGMLIMVRCALRYPLLESCLMSTVQGPRGDVAYLLALCAPYDQRGITGERRGPSSRVCLAAHIMHTFTIEALCPRDIDGGRSFCEIIMLSSAFTSLGGGRKCRHVRGVRGCAMLVIGQPPARCDPCPSSLLKANNLPSSLCLRIWCSAYRLGHPLPLKL
jgi:hypothetical protein